MSGLDPTEITVASFGHIWVARYTSGMSLPTNENSAPGSAFIDIGYVDESGVTFSASPSTEEVTAWQSATPVRRLVTTRALTVSFSMEQWNRQSFALAFGGGTWTVSSGTYKYVPPGDQDALADYALLIDASDGPDKNYRWIVFRGNVTDAVETNLVRGGAALLPVTFSALAPEGEDTSWEFYTDDVSFATVS
jgi:hypothetical protein